jgi:cytochrome c oxidase cbb3-type subunit 4
MLSYIKNHLTSIDGIEIYPIVSLVIFFTFFVGLGIYILRADRSKIEEIKQIPLDDND